MGFGGWVSRHVLATRARLIASVVALVLVVAAATTGAYAYFSDRTFQSASADSGNLGVSVTASVQDEPFGSIINTLCLLPTTPGCSLLKAVTPYQLTFTVTNNGTTPWTGDATLFDHFVNQGTEVGEKGMVQVYSSYTLLTVAQNILAGTDGDLVTPTTSDQSTMPDGSDMLGQTADAGTVTLAPGASKTLQYAAIFDPTSGTVQSCSAPYTSAGKQVCDLQLTFGMTVSATSTYLGQQSGWTGSGEGDGPVTATITVNTPPVITATTTEDLSPFAGQIGASGQPSLSTYLAGLFTATDAEDGNLTSKVTTSSSPAFDPGTAGTYTITGNVTDSGGASATPVDQKVDVWNFVDVATSYYSTIALDSQGRVWTWGYAPSGYITTPTLYTGIPGTPKIVAIAAGYNAYYAADADGNLWAWGNDNDGALGNGSGGSNNTPTKVTGLSGVVKVSSYYNTAAAVTSDGSVYTWGAGAYGALGLGGTDTSDQQTPQKLSGVSNAVDVSQGLYGGIILTGDGHAMVYGSDWHGQRGDGSAVNTVQYMSPVVVPSLSKVVSVSAGYDFMLAATADGSAYGWGYNGNDRSSPNPGVSGADVLTPTLIQGLPGNVVQVNAGNDYGTAVTADGHVYGWGYGSYDSTFTGSDASHTTPVLSSLVSDAALITGNYDDTLVLNKSGSMIYGRGDNAYGALGTGNTTASYASSQAVAKIVLTNVYAN